MLESFFSGLYNSGTDPITLSVFLTLILSALVIGAVQALVYMHNNSGSKSFVVTLLENLQHCWAFTWSKCSIE